MLQCWCAAGSSKVCINCIFMISFDDSLFCIVTHKFIHRRYFLIPSLYLNRTFRSMKQSWTCTYTEKALWGYFHIYHVNDPTPYLSRCQTQNKKYKLSGTCAEAGKVLSCGIIKSEHSEAALDYQVSWHSSYFESKLKSWENATTCLTNLHGDISRNSFKNKIWMRTSPQNTH